MTVKSLDQLNLAGKRVLVRVDYNVPMKDSMVANDSRMTASLPTLNLLLEQNCQITLMSHLGRPRGEVDLTYSMAPVAKHLAALINRDVFLVSDFADGRQHTQVQMLENLRFNPGETENNPDFAALLARYGDVYVNDAFGAAHRAHASIDAVTHHFTEKGAGLLLARELHYLKDALDNPARPFASILGGSKISDKLRLIRNLIEKVDLLVIGGGMSYTFLKARGVGIGNSLVENDFLDEAREIEKLCKEKGVDLLLPLDHLIADAFSEDAQAHITQDDEIPEGFMGLDLGPETINLYTARIREAKTIIWNGPMGVFEWEAFSTGTVSVAEALVASGGLTVIGGGDSVAAVDMAGVKDQITHISTGGGASLELLGGSVLPGVKALDL